MEITQIIKGEVKKEEREFAFSHLSLSQIEVRIVNSEDSSYSTAQLIHDAVSYDPSTANNAQIADDMRICFAWYSTIKGGFSDVKERVKKFKFSEHDVVRLAKAIYSEIEKRKREGTMKHEWNVEEMKKHSKELFEIVSKGQSLQASLLTKEKGEVNSNVSTNSKESKTLPIYPGGTSDKYPPLELSEFLNKWNSFIVKKPFISLVGSLANQEQTEGDIDILVKARDPTPLREALEHAISKLYELKEDALADLLIQVNEFLHSDSTFLNAKWRIERAFLEWSGRLHILDDSFSGPFTNFVELADLVAVSCEEKDRKEMAQLKKLKLFTWFPMLKPVFGRKKGEVFSANSVIETIKLRKEDWFETGIYVEIKYDGVHIQCHKVDLKAGSQVKLITEDGSDVTKNCPTIVKELAAKAGDWILCGEMELWKDGKHQPRADCAGILNTKEASSDEMFLRFNIFDIVYYA